MISFKRAVVAGLALLGLAGAARAEVTLFEGARLIVGDGRVVEGASLLVDGDKIVQAGAGVRAPAGARRVSLAGKTVMPMLIDTHVHTSGTPEALTRELKRRAVFGVSTVRSMGQDPYAILPMRGQVIPGAARYYSAGRGITRPEPGRGNLPYWVNTEAEVRAAVQELARNKVDIVKMWIDDRGGMFQKLTPELYRAVIDEAHRNGLQVTAHIETLEDAKGALAAGLDAMAHGVRGREIDDEFLAMVRQRPNLVINPNLPGRGVKTDLSAFAAVFSPDEAKAAATGNVDQPTPSASYGWQAKSLARLSAAGAKIVLGSDGNSAWQPHVEMEDMVIAGMTPAQVIVASTRNGAEFLKLKDAGTLEAGKSADFIVLDANPLDDIRNTRRIAAVYLRGAMVDRAQAR